MGCYAIAIHERYACHCTLKGIVGGYGSVESGTHTFDIETIIDQYRWRSHKRTFDLREYDQREKRTHLEVSYGEWPKQLLPICNPGCIQEACVDNQERMFLVAPIDSSEVYSLSQLPWNFEEWLWRWIRDEDLVPRYADAA